MSRKIVLEAQQLAKVYSDMRVTQGCVPANILFHQVCPPKSPHPSIPWGETQPFSYWTESSSFHQDGPFEWTSNSSEVENALLRFGNDLTLPRISAIYDDPNEQRFYAQFSVEADEVMDHWGAIVNLRSGGDFSRLLRRTTLLMKDVWWEVDRRKDDTAPKVNVWAEAFGSMGFDMEHPLIAEWFMLMVGLGELDRDSQIAAQRLFGNLKLSSIEKGDARFDFVPGQSWRFDARLLKDLKWDFLCDWGPLTTDGRPFALALFDDILQDSACACTWIAEMIESLPVVAPGAPNRRPERRHTATEDDLTQAMKLCGQRKLDPYSKKYVGDILRKDLNASMASDALHLYLVKRRRQAAVKAD